MSDSPAKVTYFPALDGIRGWAILMVLVAHHFNLFAGSDRLGALGVDLFFVLSGFLITQILLSTRGEKSYFAHFFKRRAFRILPLYYGALAAYFLLAPQVEWLQQDYAYYSAQWPFLFLHLNNLGQILFEKPEMPLMLNHFWSLSLEEQFYLVWPFLLWFARSRRSVLLMLYGILLLSAASRFFIWLNFTSGYFYWYSSTNIRMDCIAAGALLAALRFYYPGTYRAQYARFAACIGLAYLLLFVVTRWQLPALPHYTVAGITATAFLFGWVISRSLDTGKQPVIFTHRAIRYLGRVSYSLYVFHWPVNIVVQHYLLPPLRAQLANDTLVGILCGLVAVVFSLLIAVLCWTYFENPIRRLGYRGTGLPTVKA